MMITLIQQRRVESYLLSLRNMIEGKKRVKCELTVKGLKQYLYFIKKGDELYAYPVSDESTSATIVKCVLSKVKDDRKLRKSTPKGFVDNMENLTVSVFSDKTQDLLNKRIYLINR